ncbi:hypothetical protein [Halopelagius longus]|uniref:Uncharacterized protein n=1 Tax=Halopelagius longus TaxID=1236180 RepID=A0A1H1GUK2_9EURY|nr:hypothetical protein [Halopelagius longus]SDR16830.1 hypothetical protein SAMN05216278_3871 [Halopelagius longus]
MALPPHLQGLPEIRDWELLLEGYSDSELIEFTQKANDILRDNGLRENPDRPSFLILGSYDQGSSTREGPKDRLEDVRDILHLNQKSNFAILLEELDPDNTRWNNWYLKFQFTLLSTDYNVLVAEDNNGGHELELGEVPLQETYVAKREYTHASLDKDLEYEKFDAMMSTLFDFLDRAGHLYRWQDKAELSDAIVQIARKTM